MRFLVDASLPRSTVDVLRRYGHHGTDVRDVGLGVASDDAIAERALVDGLAILSGDFDFADIRQYPPSRYHGIVVVDRPEDATIQEVLALVESLLRREDILSSLVGRLVIVDPRRIRMRGDR